MGIGKRIKEAREAKNYTQKQLSEYIGVTSSAVANYENDISHPKEEVLYKLIEKLNVDANYLFQDVLHNDNNKKKSPPTKLEAEEALKTVLYQSFGHEPTEEELALVKNAIDGIKKGLELGKSNK